MDGAVENVHATAIAVGNRAVLIRGASGSGKSDLALRCLTLGPSALYPGTARLVADDRVILTRSGMRLYARAPDQLAGLLEIRGIGVISVGTTEPSSLVLVADIATDQRPDRLPDPWANAALLGLSVPLIQIAPFECSAPAKLLLALTSASLPPLRAQA